MAAQLERQTVKLLLQQHQPQPPQQQHPQPPEHPRQHRQEQHVTLHPRPSLGHVPQYVTQNVTQHVTPGHATQHPGLGLSSKP
jgi:hypothetical protein